MNIRKRVWTWKGHKRSAWQLHWRERGKRRQKQFPTRREAELYRDKLIREGEAEKYGVLKGPMTLKEFIDVYEKAKPWRTDSYRERATGALRRCRLRDLALDEIRSEMVGALRDERLQSVAPSTVRQELAALSDCLRWAIKLGYLRKNSAAEVEKPALVVKQDAPAHYIPYEEFEKLLKVSGRDACLWQFMAWTGLRITEVLTLTWDDLNLPERWLLVRRGKGRKQRLVPLLRPTLDALRKVPRQLKSTGRIFWWASDRHACLRRLWRRCERAEIPKYQLHDLRRTFGSWAASSGVDLEVIAQCMGHTSTTVTKLYAHLHPDYRRKELTKMESVTRRQQRRRKSLKSQRLHPY